MEKAFLSENSRGSIMILALIILGVMVFSSTYLLSFTVAGLKTVESYDAGVRAYYLAEAGISEAVFKLKNDAAWKSAFETMPSEEDPACSAWSIPPYSRLDALGSGNSYEITIANSGCAKAEITATARISAGDNAVARRVVKLNVFKPMGSPAAQYGILSSGASDNVEISAANPLRIHSGDFLSNGVLYVKDGSIVQTDGKVLAAAGVVFSSGGQIEGTVCSPDVCDEDCTASSECPPAAIAPPFLDFTSSEPDSYISRAQNSDCGSVRSDGKVNCLFTPDEFEAMLWSHYPQFSSPAGTVIYVTGDANIRAGQELTINGVLASGRDINLGTSLCWTRSEYPYLRCGFAQVVVSRPGEPEDALSGLLAFRKINTSSWLGIGFSALNVEGLIYSGDETKLSSIAAPIVVHGGIVAKKLTLSSLWNGIDIYLNPDVIVDVFGSSEYSPIISIDHWEEEY
ncbi:MAG: hypothetical protein PHU56_01675 [Candidatus Pacebacteria bacterium]|nr:hypothetical protein [Candidatus Paceibacterota bacterium]